MAKHEVRCVRCNRLFDENAEGGIYISRSRRYMCLPCATYKKRRRKKIMRICAGIFGFSFAGGALLQSGQTWSLGVFVTGEIMAGLCFLYVLWPKIKK